MRYIPLTQGKQTIVDDEDFEWLSKWKWQYHINSNGKYKYAGYAAKYKGQRMHRLIMGNPLEDIDHINGNTLDNRKCNLRLADKFQQNQNSSKRRDNISGCRGVNYFKPRKTWMVRIQYMNKRILLGYFHNKEEAICAYKKASKKYFKAFERKAY